MALLSPHSKIQLGWMYNMVTTEIALEEEQRVVNGIRCFLVRQDGSTFSAISVFQPYFLVQVSGGATETREVEAFLTRRFNKHIVSMEPVEKIDLDMSNHLSGIKRRLIKVSFHNEENMFSVRSHIRRNRIPHVTAIKEYDVKYLVRTCIDRGLRVGMWYEVTPLLHGNHGCSFTKRTDIEERPVLRTLAFDIECTKEPLKFPQKDRDEVMMISYMLDEQGWLLVNRAVVSQDIEPFEYTPKKEYPGEFKTVNLEDERALLRYFFDHCRREKPQVYVTFNGDFFDWPFVAARALKYGMDMKEEIGIWCDAPTNSALGGGVFTGHDAIHLDCFKWVQRDSYLPQGSQGLKAVVKAKLKYDPLELDPEVMTPYAREKPQVLASYSVSDAVATYYLYQIYVNSFIFSLCTILPLAPDDVLRKGTGTLCEVLLMVEAFEKDILFPDKQNAAGPKFHEGHLIESETYIGGHVECLESGVFRADFDYDFALNPNIVQMLLDELPATLRFSIENEGGFNMDKVTNYQEVEDKIRGMLEALRDRPKRRCKPLIYHLDVGAMYPNIILTNRLQPMAMVDRAECASCQFQHWAQHPNKAMRCQRWMNWQWRGKYIRASRAEYNAVRDRLEMENPVLQKLPVGSQQQFGGRRGRSSNSRQDNRQQNERKFREDLEWEKRRAGGKGGSNTHNRRRNRFRKKRDERKGGWRRMNDTPTEVRYNDAPWKEQQEKVKELLENYSQNTYKQKHVEKVEMRAACVCQRENPFYVDCVRNFRDRRYLYKGKKKVWGKKLKKAQQTHDAAAIAEARNFELLYDSMQLAHKCILNSFYGYVMRKGSRWMSIQMAGVVTHTGGCIIKDANQLVSHLGRPLELDTDGIWCMLPCDFPEEFTFKVRKEEESKETTDYTISYPCIMLNKGTYDKYNNPQYATLKDEGSRQYETKKECTIYFEVDGPYKCMVLPAAREEGKNIKKRYAVFDFRGKLVELKGFELKRRGELKLIKLFQSKVFAAFLLGTNLEEVYAEVAQKANYYLGMLDNQGKDLTDDEVFEFISEAKVMKMPLAHYGDRKTTTTTTARRMGEFLGKDLVNEEGVTCRFVVARKPLHAPRSQRAVPVAIFAADPAVKREKLREWLKDPSMSTAEDFDIRQIVDWAYYRERLSNAIQKIITIPAAFQEVKNPVPSVPHPDWLTRSLRRQAKAHLQRRITDMFAAQNDGGVAIEDSLGKAGSAGDHAMRVRRVLRRKRVRGDSGDGDLSGDDAGSWSEQDEKAAEQQDTSAAPLVAETKSAAPGALPDPQTVDMDQNFPLWLLSAQNQWDQRYRDNVAYRRSVGLPVGKRAALRHKGKKTGVHAMTATRSGGAGSGAVPPPDSRLSEALVRGGLAGYARQAQQNLQQGPWQIVQAYGSESQPGVFHVWAFQGSRLFRTKVAVPRTFYVNCMVPEGVEPNFVDETSRRDLPTTLKHILHIGGRPVTKTLPRGHHPHTVFECSMPEATYRRENRALERLFGAKEVLGTYERECPLWYRLLLNTGSVVRCEAEISTSSTVDLSAFQPFSSPSVKYMRQFHENGETANFQKLFIYHSNGGRGRSVWVLVPEGAALRFGAQESMEKGVDERVYVVACSPTRTEITPIAGDAWTPMVHSAMEAAGFDPACMSGENLSLVSPIERVEAEVAVRSSPTEAAAKVDAILNSLREKAAVPFVAVCQSTESLQSMYRLLPQLEEHFPCVCVPYNSRNDQYDTFNWFQPAVEWGVVRFWQHHEWWLQSLGLARFSQVPVGNLASSFNATSSIGSSGTDRVSTVWDVLFGRALQQQHRVLWASESPEPDLGGALDTDSGILSAEGKDSDSGALCVEPVSKPGCYRYVCVELSVADLCVQAVTRYEQLEEYEATIDDRKGPIVGGANAVLGPAKGPFAEAFVSLKTALDHLMDLSVVEESGEAHELIRGFYRWLKSPSSLLFDGGVHRTVYQLVRSVFRLFVATLRKLQAQVVYADLNRVVISTGHVLAPRALSYTHYIVDALKDNPMFKFVPIEYTRTWESLLWLDTANYAGICSVEMHDEDIAREADAEVGEQFEDVKSDRVSDGEEMKIDEMKVEDSAMMVAGDSLAVDDEALISYADMVAKYRTSTVTTAPPSTLPPPPPPPPPSSLGLAQDVVDDIFVEEALDVGRDVAAPVEEERKDASSSPARHMPDISGAQSISSEAHDISQLQGISSGVRDIPREALDGDEQQQPVDYGDLSNSESSDAVRRKQQRALRRRKHKRGPSRRSTGRALPDSGDEDGPDLSVSDGGEEEEQDNRKSRLLHAQLRIGTLELLDPQGDGEVALPLRYRHRWNLATFLPEECAHALEQVVAAFLVDPYLYRRAVVANLQAQHGEAAVTVWEKEEAPKYVKYLQGFVCEQLAQQLYLVVRDFKTRMPGDPVGAVRKRHGGSAGFGSGGGLRSVSRLSVRKATRSLSTVATEHKHNSGAGADDDDRDAGNALFPRPPGWHVPMHDAALEFCKSLCHVLELDADTVDVTRDLRRNLLRICGVHEFAARAKWVNPCQTWVLESTVCEFCQNCCNLDLCRDPLLVSGAWECAVCHHAYDKGAIEAELVRRAQSMSRDFQQQVPRCQSCHKPRGDVLSRDCSCGEAYVLPITRSSWNKSMTVFANMARTYEMEWLSHTVADLAKKYTPKAW